MLKSKDVLTGGAIIGLGYLLFTYKSGKPGTGGGGSESLKEAAGIAVDELGGLGVSTPNYTINIPKGGGGDTIVFPDFPVPPGGLGILEETEPDKPFNWPKFPDEVNTLVGFLGSFFKDKGNVIPLDPSGMPKKSEKKIKQEAFFGAIGSGIQSFFAVKTPLADMGIGQSGSNIKSKKGRSQRVAEWKRKHGEPTYNVTHRVKVDKRPWSMG